MPNYSLVMNSKFQPFSFERYIQPLQIYGQAYREQEDALTELDTKASVWEGLTNAQTDPIAHAQYQKFANDLRNQANILASEGLNPTSRQAMLNLRGRYAKEIIPIEQAVERRRQLAKEQRDKGNSMIYDMDAATTSLDKFLANPELQYRSIDRKDLLNRSMVEFGTLAKSLEKYGKGDKVDDYTNTFIQQYGITREAASEFINAVRSGNIEGTNSTLQAIYNSLYDSTGVSGWNNTAAKNAVRNTILEGVVAGIGQTNISTVENYGSRQALQLKNQKTLVDYKAQQTAAQQQAAEQAATIRAWDPGETTIYLNNTVTEERTKVGKQAYNKFLRNHQEDIEQSKINKEYNDMKNSLRNIVTNYSGEAAPSFQEAAKRWNVYMIQATTRGESTNTKHYSNMGWTDKYGNLTDKGYRAIYSEDREVIDYKSQAKAAQKAAEEEYDKGLKGSGTKGSVKVMRLRVDGAGLENSILSAIGERGKLYKVDDYDGKENKVISKSSVKYKDLVDAFNSTGEEKLSIVYIGNIPDTDQQMIQTSDGKWYLLPDGVYSNTQKENISRANKNLQNSGLNEYEKAVNGNNLMIYLGAPLNTHTGTNVKTNNGTIMVQ